MVFRAAAWSPVGAELCYHPQQWDSLTGLVGLKGIQRRIGSNTEHITDYNVLIKSRGASISF